MAQAAGTAVDHDADLAVGQPESLRRGRVVDLVHRLHLQEMVARAETAHLTQPTVHGPHADLPGIGIGDSALIFTAQHVAVDAIAVFQRVPGAACQHVPQLPEPARCQMPPRPAPRGTAAAS